MKNTFLGLIVLAATPAFAQDLPTLKTEHSVAARFENTRAETCATQAQDALSAQLEQESLSPELASLKERFGIDRLRFEIKLSDKKRLYLNIFGEEQSHFLFITLKTQTLASSQTPLARCEVSMSELKLSLQALRSNLDHALVKWEAPETSPLDRQTADRTLSSKDSVLFEE